MAVEADAGAVVELLLLLLFAAGVDPAAGAGAVAGVVDELKLKPGVIEGPAGF